MEKGTRRHIRDKRKTGESQRIFAAFRFMVGTLRGGARISFLLLAGILAITARVTAETSAPLNNRRLAYPPARRVNQVDDFHGTKVADPYRWLEEENSPETRAWIEAENKLTFDYLSRIAERPRIKERLTQLWNYERYGIPFQEGGRYFFTRNDGLQNQSALYMLQSLDAAPQLLLDPNALSPDGTVALSGSSVNDDGKLLAYGLSTPGSDWQEWRVRAIGTGRVLPGPINWGKSSTAA